MFTQNGSTSRLLMAFLLIFGLIGLGTFAGCSKTSSSRSSSPSSQDGDESDPPPPPPPPDPEPEPTAPVSLQWDAPATNADGSELTDLGGYNLYYGNKPGIYTAQVDVANTTAVQVESLSPGTYYFAVTAYDTSGNESEFSNEVSTVVQ